MTFDPGTYRAQNGATVHIMHRHHNILLDGWVRLSEDGGAGGPYEWRDGEKICRCQWVVQGDRAIRKKYLRDGTRNCNLDLIEKISDEVLYITGSNGR